MEKVRCEQAVVIQSKRSGCACLAEESKKPEQKLQERYRAENKEIYEKFEIRNIKQEEAEETAKIERICFSPEEACSREMMVERVIKAPELFLAAVDKCSGRIAGFVNGLSTNENVFRDEFFMDASLYDPDGKNIMLLGLEVLPAYRRQGLAKELMRQYLRREWEKGRREILLTCRASKVEMYKKMGFHDKGIANSSWGGSQWHEMGCTLHFACENALRPNEKV